MPSSTFTAVGWSTFTVPAKVTSISVVLDGAGSGDRPGGRVTGKLAVKPGDKLYCHVGQAGKIHSGSTPGGTATGGGGAGGAGHTYAGGNSGGGATFIRFASTSGSVRAVAGGAGGDSGDGGIGGDGGGTTGGFGRSGTAGTSEVGSATGGTQSQGGNGGTSSYPGLAGGNASDVVLSAGGTGGSSSPTIQSHGGGGGGGGFHPGGGGQASSNLYAAGGGGAGGSSYTGGLTGATNTQGGGGTGNGSISLTWVSPSPANQPPTPPTDVKLNGVDEEDGMLTKATSSVKITATVNDPNSGDSVRMIARWSTSSAFTSYRSAYSSYVQRGKTATVELTGLSQNTHYYVRLYTQDNHKLYSTTYNSLDFWTNRAPEWATDLTVNTQGSGMQLSVLSSATFAWTHVDPDKADYQAAFTIRYRKAATAANPAGSWVEFSVQTGQNLAPVVEGPPSSSRNQWVFNPNTFRGNFFYEWQVKTRDVGGLWGPYSDTFVFYASAVSTPPLLITPVSGHAVNVSDPVTFTWKFLDPDPADQQLKADLRYRVVGATKDVSAMTIIPGQSDTATDWITILGGASPSLPGAQSAWSFPVGTFVEGYTYEWQVRTYDTSGSGASGWSDSSYFHAISPPGGESETAPFADISYAQGSLGCGTYRVFIYEQGGRRRLGEIEPISGLRFSRVRDDISTCTTVSSGYSYDCGALYGQIRTWMHELVVFRDGVRVWEGPLTRIAYTRGSVEFEAKDVMAYCYRRILRQGYNDTYRLIEKGEGGQPDVYLGLMSVVKRAAELITQGLAPYDPNVLPYLTAIEYPDDARESRYVEGWSRTVWEEVDDLAATGGLDYTTVGRRIILWDTHRPIGRLPELRDGDFSNAPVVTEYGMQLATLFGVTNGSGVYGTYEVAAKTDPYGPIELLASAYNDATSASAEIQTPAALEAMQATLVEQAQRNIAGRWPAPLIVRIPDNSTLSPEANVGFQQLVPGVWLPLRSEDTPRKVVQWQKLDSVNVEVDENGEKVNVVLSPAPNGGNDPDADAAATEEG